MNGMGKLWLFAAIQAMVTAMLLVFSYVMRNESPALAEIVVGASVFHWLNQSTYLGRQLNEQLPKKDHGP
jgi:ABC-type polysaccharide/polyol phosphate export permease